MRVILSMAVVVVCAAAPLQAELRVTSVVEVTAQRLRDSELFPQILMSVLPFRVAVGKVEVVSVAARGSVRVDGLGAVLGLPADAVLISTPDGRTVCLLPSTREFFWMPVTTPATFDQFFAAKARVNRRGGSDKLLGQKTERVSVHLSIAPKMPAAGDEVWSERHGRMIHKSQLVETDQERVRREMRGSNDVFNPDPITIDNWTSDAYGPAASLIASAASHISALATAGFSALAERPFALRQVIVNPTSGYKVESRVTAVEAAAVDDAVFRVPADYREIAPLPPRR
jgi:hypothetical protein